MAPRPDPLEAAFAAVHGAGPVERRVAPAGTEDPPVAGISAYRAEDHWHLVTHGLAAAVGHELTVLTAPAERPPDWAFALLLGVARTVRAAGRGLHAGARLAPGGPVDGAGSGLVAVGIRADPLVTPPADGPALLQVVGVTAGEHALMGRVGTALVLEKLAARDALLRTDPARA